MALHKWEIAAGDVVVGLMYDEPRGRASLGGLARLRDVLETLAVVAFERPEHIRWSSVQRNKIRHTWSCTWEQLRASIERATSRGYAVHRVQHLGRLMI